MNFWQYRVKRVLPTKYLWGSALVLLCLFQFVSGVAALRIGTEDRRTILLLHGTVPYIILFAAVVHIARVLVAGTSSVSSVFSGFATLCAMLLTMVTGYASSGGEAGYWGSVIMTVWPVALVSEWSGRLLEEVGRILFLSEVRSVLYPCTAAIKSSLVGSSSLSGLSGEYFLNRLHVLAALAFLVLLVQHMSTSHRFSTGARRSARVLPGGGLVGATEARDLRLFTAICLVGAGAAAILVRVLRVGNNVRVSSLLQPPAQVNTEFYLSSPYLLLRMVPLRTVLFLAGCLLF